MRLKNAAMVVTIGLLGVLLGTAAKADTKSEYDHKYNLAKVSTWGFLKQNQNHDQAPRNGIRPNEIWDRDIRDDIGVKLASDGFTKAADGQEPDFQVAYHMAAMEGYYPYPGWGWGRPWGFWGYRGWGPVWAVPFTRSTLVVDIVDTKSNQLVWRGYDNRTIDFNHSDKTIGQSVNKLMSRFSHDVKESRKKQPH
jgi:hypothetical protein